MRALLSQVRQIYSREHPVFARSEGVFRRALSRSVPIPASGAATKGDDAVEIVNASGPERRDPQAGLDVDVLPEAASENLAKLIEDTRALVQNELASTFNLTDIQLDEIAQVAMQKILVMTRQGASPPSGAVLRRYVYSAARDLVRRKSETLDDDGAWWLGAVYGDDENIVGVFGEAARIEYRGPASALTEIRAEISTIIDEVAGTGALPAELQGLSADALRQSIEVRMAGAAYDPTDVRLIVVLAPPVGHHALAVLWDEVIIPRLHRHLGGDALGAETERT